MPTVTENFLVESMPYPAWRGKVPYAFRSQGFRTKQVGFSRDWITPLPYKREIWRMEWQNPLGDNLTTDHWTDVGEVWWQYSDPFRSAIENSISSLPREFRAVYNDAYSKFRERLSADTADLLTLIREHKLARDLVHKRLVQFAHLTDLSVAMFENRNRTSRRAKKAQSLFKEKFVRLLAMSPSEIPAVRKKLRFSLKKSRLFTVPSELILEMRWGWLPMVDDIYKSLVGLNAPPPRIAIWGSSKYEKTVQRSERSGREDMTQFSFGTFRVRVGGQIEVTNRSLHEIERLGLSNLGQSLYETTAYSWLLDWVSSVGDVISSIDDNLVCKVDNSYVTRCWLDATDTYRYWDGSNGRGVEFKRSRVHMKREVIPIPKPLLTVFSPDLSPWRIATACSLLILKLSKVKTSLPFNPN